MKELKGLSSELKFDLLLGDLETAKKRVDRLRSALTETEFYLLNNLVSKLLIEITYLELDKKGKN